MTPFEEMSREELIKAAKAMEDGLLHQANSPSISTCPFCMGSAVVPTMKCDVKRNLVISWGEPVTKEEWASFVEERNKQWEAMRA